MKKNKLRIKKLEGTPYGVSIDEVIDTASFSTIFRAYNLEDPKEDLAVKVISCQNEDASLTIKSQIQAIKSLPHHPNLVNCKKAQISSEKNFYLVMQFCREGNLEKYLYRQKFELPEERIWFFLKQFCEGYKVLFDANIIHRDLKPQNILISNGDFKIADFGLSKKVLDNQIMQNVSTKGTPIYMAPELHFEHVANKEVDVFSLGVILYRMAFHGKHPFYETGRYFKSINQYFRSIMAKKLVFPPNHNRSSELVNLISRMLEKNNGDRIKWVQIFQIQRITKAVRFERKKELHPIEELKRSIIIANRSITQVNFLQQKMEDQSKQHGHSLIIQQTFCKEDKNLLQKKLYHYKLLYTIICHTNKKIEKYLGEKVHENLKKRMSKIIASGLKFSLLLIKRLEDMSGNWNSLNQGQIMNFQDIFDNDKNILTGQLKLFYAQSGMAEETFLSKPYIDGQYEDHLYAFLTQFHEYPQFVKDRIKIIIALLIDIYDLVLKINEKHLEEESKSKIEFVEDESVDQFYSYLTTLQNIQESQIMNQLTKKGLLFL